MEIVISGKNKKALKLIEKLSKELGLVTRVVSSEKENEEELLGSDKLFQLMEEMAASGGLDSIKDPIAWQKEIRQDSTLTGREE